MKKRDFFGYVAITLAATGCAGLIWYAGFAPHYLRIAVAPQDGVLSRFFTALSTTLEREHASIRLKVQRLSTPEAVEDAIRKRRADLAVVRSDMQLPASTLAVAAFQEFIVLTLANPEAKITGFGDLAAKRVAIIGGEKADTTLFHTLARLHGMQADEVKTIVVPDADQITSLVKNNRIDAVFVVAPRGTPLISASYEAFAEALTTPPVFVPLGDIKARPAFNLAFTKAEITTGEIQSATPRVPGKNIRTISFPALIVSRNSIASSAIQEFTKNLFAYRLSLVSCFPVAARVTAIPTKRDSPFPVHPGAAIYYDASEVSFLEKYSELLWLLFFGASGVASIFVWFWRLAIPKTRMAISEERGRLVELIARARNAGSHAELEDIQRESDTILVTISEQLYNGTIDPERQPSFDLLLTRLDEAIAGRNEQLKPT
jgi:TRAP-type uncharacterized transport system substrate-binding protein